MELNAEINKIVGEELSKILIKKIDNDELERMAMDSYKRITTVRSDSYGYSSSRKSDLDYAIESMFLNRLKEEAGKIMDSEGGQNRIRQATDELINQIISRTKEKIIESVSSRIAILSVGYQGLNMESMIDDAIHMEFSEKR